MAVQTLTMFEAAQVQVEFDRMLDALIARLAPEPGDRREAIRYELAWRARRVSERIIDELALSTPPPRSPPGYWVEMSKHLGAVARGVVGEFDDLDRGLLANGTPTEFIPTLPPEQRLCARCGGAIPKDAAAIEVCGACRASLVEIEGR